METATAVAPNGSSTVPLPFSQEDVTMELPKKDISGNYYVFFAADLIDGAVKSNNPEWAAGGVLRTESLGLKYKLGYVRKCEITNLRPQVFSELASYVQPEERKHLAATVDMRTANGIQKLGEIKIDRDKRTTAKEGAVGVKHDGLLRTIFYPVDEIGRLTGQVDGLVQMPCVNGLEAVKAQYFLFPNWDAILNGTVELPTKISELEAYFHIRKNQAEDTWENKVADAAIKSCTDFRDWGTKDVSRANSIYRSMQTKGFAWSYGAETELAFTQLGLQRQDTIVQEQSDKLDRLTDSIAQFVEVSISNAGGKQPEGPTADDLAEFFAWKAANTVKKHKPRGPERFTAQAGFPPLNVGDPVTVDDRLATVLVPKSDFGRVKVKFADTGEEKSFGRKFVAVIPEEK